MTAVMVSAVVMALLLGPLSGWLTFRRLAAGEYRRGLLAGELQAKLVHGWHPPVDADEAAVRSGQARNRSPDANSADVQPLWQYFPVREPRPVLHHRQP